MKCLQILMMFDVNFGLFSISLHLFSKENILSEKEKNNELRCVLYACFNVDVCVRGDVPRQIGVVSRWIIF